MIPKTFNDSSRSQACHRLLLLAGADPLIGARRGLADESAATLNFVAESGTPVSLTSQFHDIGSDIISGRTQHDALSCQRSHRPRAGS